MKYLYLFFPIILFAHNSLHSYFILTAPHGHCIPLLDRQLCDKVSKQAATLLHKKLHNAILLLSTHYREYTDLNREEARITKFRENIRAHLTQCRKKRTPCVLIDVHSFPENSLKEMLKGHKKQTKVQLITPQGTMQCSMDTDTIDTSLLKAPIYLLASFYDNHLAKFLQAYLRNKHGIAIPIFKGHPSNDIMLEATYYKVPSVLIEFKESLNSQELNEITSIIAEALDVFNRGE